MYVVIFYLQIPLEGFSVKYNTEDTLWLCRDTKSLSEWVQGIYFSTREENCWVSKQSGNFLFILEAPMKYQTISLLLELPRQRCYVLCKQNNGDLFMCEVKMLFSRRKISCFHAKAQLVFQWCLYDKKWYFTPRQ